MSKSKRKANAATQETRVWTGPRPAEKPPLPPAAAEPPPTARRGNPWCPDCGRLMVVEKTERMEDGRRIIHFKCDGLKPFSLALEPCGRREKKLESNS